ncbi:MAG: dienelactone hydrolase family protein [Sphingomicrobium sp.]
MDERTRAAIELYDRFTHEGMDRRDFFARMTRIAGSAAAANLLIGTIAASADAAPLSNPADPHLVITKGKLGWGSPLSGYVAAQKSGKKRGLVLVIHENRGLNAHIEDVARRVALEGFIAIAPDLLSPVGGTPANEDAAREAIGKLNLAAAVSQAIDLGDHARHLRHANGKLGIVGFCWGGAFVNRFAVAAGRKLDAGVAYYGPAPGPAEAVKVQAPLLLHYAGLDTRVAATAAPWVAALKAAHKDVTEFTYPNVDHAFNNDTSAERYNKPAAELAWSRTIAFLHAHLG